MTLIDTARDTLIKRGIASPISIRGCSLMERNEIATAIGLELPQSYNYFLELDFCNLRSQDQFKGVLAYLSRLASVASNNPIWGLNRKIAKVQLETMGRGAGRFYRGSDIFYPSMLGLTEIGREIVSEGPAKIDLPSDVIVFAMHQGYEFLFIRASEGQDPPVYYYLESSGSFTKKADTFSRFILESALGTW